MQIPTPTNLTEMMRKAPLNEQTAAVFRDQALQAIDQAIDTFFKPQREVSEGKEAYDKLCDVQSALRTYQSRFQTSSASLQKELKEAAQARPGQSFRGDVGQTASALPNGKPLKNGHRVSRCHTWKEQVPDVSDEQARIAETVLRMGEVLPLYGSVAMVPGPLSVSLKNHFKQIQEWSSQGHSGSRTVAREESFSLLGFQRESSQTHSVTSSHTSASGESETSTVDERVIPGLCEVREALARVGYAGPMESGYSRTITVEEAENVTAVRGMLWWKEEYQAHQVVNSGSYQETGTVVTVPGRLHMSAGISNQGLTRPGAGSDLVDLVAAAKLNQEFVDTFRDRCQQVIDDATATLFHADREVAEGRRRFDELTNMRRALLLAEQRFGKREAFAEEIARLNELTPLYACLAMVPGELSSCVKNFAKELSESRFEASSNAFAKTSSSDSSLLTASVSEGQANSTTRSSAKGETRRTILTTDERLMPLLHDLRMGLDQLALEQSSKGTVLTIRRPQPPQAPRVARSGW